MQRTDRWDGPDGRLGTWLKEFSKNTLDSYRVKPELVTEHDNLERSTVESGYGRKQLNELAQNAADAMEGTTGRVAFVLTDSALYCANEGAPLAKGGLEALLMSHSSQKRDDKIGRFGLGFKSVLELTDAPEIISRTISVRWNRYRAASAISEIVPGREHYPVLRVAEAFDPAVAAADDPVLRELMAWATSVVRLPMTEVPDWLNDEFKLFPKEFVLFADQIKMLEFDNRHVGDRRFWHVERTGYPHERGERVVLRGASEQESWDVFHLPHVPSDEAMRDAGSIAARSELRVSWAVPVKNRGRGVGKIWNHFPTQSFTTLSGVINAAFKLNEDRQNMLAGIYNEEILTRTLPQIVAFALPDLVDPQDPGSFLDILPARGREARSWADEILNRPVMTTVSRMNFVPDRAGVLRPPASLNIEPELEDANRITSIWDASVGEDRPWAHRSLTSTRDRNATLNRLLDMAQKERSSTLKWIEEVVFPGTTESYSAALRIAVEINQRHPELQRDMRSARIIPAADGSLQRPVATAIFLPMDADDLASNFVSPELARAEKVRDLLRKLDIGPLNAQGQLKKVIAALSTDDTDPVTLESLWTLSRSVPFPDALTLLEKGPGVSVPVRCEDGVWRPASKVWLRGGLFSPNGVEDPALVVDGKFHEPDVRILHALGVPKNLKEPARITSGALHQVWKSAISQAIVAIYRDKLTPVSAMHLSFAPPFATNGLELLIEASAEVRAKATEWILSQRHYDVDVKISNQYVDDHKVSDPDIWWAREHGAVTTAFGIVDARYAVASVEGIPDGFLPVPQFGRNILGDVAALLQLPVNPHEFKWPFIYSLANKQLEITQLHQLYGLAAHHGYPKPRQISVKTRYGRSEQPLDEARVAVNRKTYDYLAESRDTSVLWVEREELRHALEEEWGLEPIEITFESTLKFEPVGDELTLMKRIPFVQEGVRGISKIVTVPCSSLYVEHINSAGDPPSISQRETVLQNDYFYYKSELPQRVWLQQLLDVTGKKSSAQMVLASASAAKKRYDQDAHLKVVLSKQSDEEKLLALVGEATIRKLIPDHVYELVDSRLKDEEVSGTELVRLASTLHGASLLQKIKPYLEQQGINTPDQFRGSSEAKKFVAGLGISEDFAGQANDPRKPDREEAVGPVRLNPMHDYQADVSAQVRTLLAGQSRNRAIVQLPTGAGKTRVAVQSIVEHVGTADGHSLVVWIAQTEELCEQAVDAWLYVWQGAGVPGERMAVSRLWGGRRPKPEETRLHVVVATIQTLSKMAEENLTDFKWLFAADILVVDEAHGAIAPSYTSVFRAFGRGNTDRGKPLLGLSATPFRGINEAETERLVRRFDGHLLMPTQFTSENAHKYLQGIGVLAQVRHEALDGISIQLTGGAVRSAGADSAMLETRIDLEAVGRNQTRNDAILDHVKAVAEHSTALVFAASVNHAEALAAVLTREGARAAAISSKTSPADRRRQIEDFRTGKIRVLTNFDVLSQGFDAPKVGAVYVCRPTFAPNKYLQMIGRGLRGPKNGGSDEVLIVNVKDNIENFGDKLAFNHFEYLWNENP